MPLRPLLAPSLLLALLLASPAPAQDADPSADALAAAAERAVPDAILGEHRFGLHHRRELVGTWTETVERTGEDGLRVAWIREASGEGGPFAGRVLSEEGEMVLGADRVLRSATWSVVADGVRVERVVEADIEVVSVDGEVRRRGRFGARALPAVRWLLARLLPAEEGRSWRFAAPDPDGRVHAWSVRCEGPETVEVRGRTIEGTRFRLVGPGREEEEVVRGPDRRIQVVRQAGTPVRAVRAPGDGAIEDLPAPPPADSPDEAVRRYHRAMRAGDAAEVLVLLDLETLHARARRAEPDLDLAIGEFREYLAAKVAETGPGSAEGRRAEGLADGSVELEVVEESGGEAVVRVGEATFHLARSAGAWRIDRLP